MSTPYHSTPRVPAPPHPTPLSVSAFALSRSKPKHTRAPIQNPYEKFSKEEFDAFIGDLTSTLRRALGRDDEGVSGSVPPEGEAGDADRSFRYPYLGPDETFDEPAEDSFAAHQARRKAKGKTRDPGEGPGLGLGLGKGDRAEPIEIASSDEEDAQEVERSVLSVAPDEESEEDEGCYSEDEEDEDEEEEYDWEGGQSSSRILPPSITRDVEQEADWEEEEEGEGLYEDLEKQYEEYRGGEGDEYEEEQEYDEDEEDGPKPHLRVASEEIIEIADSDDEEPAVQPPTRQAALADDEDGEEDFEEDEYGDEEEEPENYQEDNIRLGTSHLSRRNHDFMRRPRQYAEQEVEEEREEQEGFGKEEQEHEVIEDDDEIEEIQPIDADTSFPPRASLSPIEAKQPVQIPDPWSGPRQYAEDFYSGGDIRASPEIDAHHLGPMDTEPVQDIVDSDARRQGLSLNVNGDEDEEEDPNIVQPLSEDTSFPPPHLKEGEEGPEPEIEREVDLPDPWAGPKAFAEDFYSGGDAPLHSGARASAHYLGPMDVEYAGDVGLAGFGRVEPEVSIRVEGVGEEDEEEVQPLSEDTSFPPQRDEENPRARSLSVELPDPWAGPQTYAEDFYSGGDVLRPGPASASASVREYQIDPALLVGSADVDLDDSIDNFLTPGVGTPNLSEGRGEVDEFREGGEEEGDAETREEMFVHPQPLNHHAPFVFPEASAPGPAAAVLALANGLAAAAAAADADLASRRSAPIPADAEIINIDDSDEEEQGEQQAEAEEERGEAEGEEEGEVEDEDEEEGEGEGQAFEASSDIGEFDYDHLDFIYPDFEVGQGNEDGDVSMRSEEGGVVLGGEIPVGVREEVEERAEVGGHEVHAGTDEDALAGVEVEVGAPTERPAEGDEDVRIGDFGVDEEGPAGFAVHTVEDEEAPSKEEAVAEEQTHGQKQEREPVPTTTVPAAPSSPLISEPRSLLSETPEDRGGGDRLGPNLDIFDLTASIEIIEEDEEEFDELQSSDDVPRPHPDPHPHSHSLGHPLREYVLPGEVVEPETASEYTAAGEGEREREGSVVEVDVIEEVQAEAPVESEVLLPSAAASSPPLEPQISATAASSVKENEVAEEGRNLVDDDDFDDMYLDEPVVPQPAVPEAVGVEGEAGGSAIAAEEERIEVDEPQPGLELEGGEDEPREVVVDLADIEAQGDLANLDLADAVEEPEFEPLNPEIDESAPDFEIEDVQPSPRPEEELEDVAVEAFDYSASVAGTSSQTQGQLPTPPSEGARYVPLPPMDEHQPTHQEKKHHVTIEEVPDEDAYIPQPVTADTIEGEGEMAVGTSTEERVEVEEYTVEEVEEDFEEGTTDDDADGEVEDPNGWEGDISLVSVASAEDMTQRWDEERDGRLEFEEPVTEGRLTEEPHAREMSLGVISVNTEAAAAFSEGIEAQDLEREGEDQVPREEVEVEMPLVDEEEGIPFVEGEVPPEKPAVEALDVTSEAEGISEVEVQGPTDIPEADEPPASDLASMKDPTGHEEFEEEGLDYIETDLTTTTDLPEVPATEEEVELADEPVSEDVQIAATVSPTVGDTGAEDAAEDSTAPSLDTDALADSTHEVVVSIPTVDSDFGWAEIPEPPMPITADPNVPDPVDHTVEGPLPTTLPAAADESAAQARPEEPAPAPVPVPPSSNAVLQPLDAGPVEPQSLLPPTLTRTDGLFTPAEPVDGVLPGESLEDVASRALNEYAQAFFWPGSQPAYMSSSAFGGTSGTSTPNTAQASGSQQALPDVPAALRVGAQPPFIPDQNSAATQDVFGNVPHFDGPSGSMMTFDSSVMSVPLTRGAPVYLGTEKVSGDHVETDKGEGTSPEKASKSGGSSKQSSKRKRDAASQKGKGRKASKAERRKSQVSKEAESEPLGDEIIIVKRRPENEKGTGSAKRFPSELSQGSHSASGASLARQVLKPSSRASSIASSAPSVGTQPSPTINKPNVPPHPTQAAQLPPTTLFHAHGARRKALAQAMTHPPMKTQVKKPQINRVSTTSRNLQQPTTPTHTTAPTVPSPVALHTSTVPDPPASTAPTAVPAEQAEPAAASDKATPSRQMSLPSVPTSSTTTTGRSTRSHCRYHRISLPKEEGGPRVCFLVPGCSLNDKELMEEEEIEDHGDATVEDSQRMISDVESLGFSLELIGILRQLVGLDILREQEVFYLPQPGEEVQLPRRHFARPSISSRSAAVRDSSSHAGSPDYSGPLRSPASNRPPNSGSTAVSGIRRAADSEKESTVASTDTESEATDDEHEPASKRARPSPPEEQAVMGPPTQPANKKKQKSRRGRKADLTYQPEEEPEEASDEDQSTIRKPRKFTALRGVKRTRPSEAALAHEGDERGSKKLKSHSTTVRIATPEQEITAT